MDRRRDRQAQMEHVLFPADEMQAMDLGSQPAEHPFTPWIEHYGVVMSLEEADALFKELLLTASWARRMLRLHGKEVEMPRDIAWYGATKEQGRYSADARPWPPYLLRAKAWVEEKTGFVYNGCLCNLYRDGSISVACHSDREAFGGAVASLSLGAKRIFKVRDKEDHRIAFDFPLVSGSLLLMRPGCQEHSEHCVPKTSKVVGPRINLTFRQVKS